MHDPILPPRRLASCLAALALIAHPVPVAARSPDAAGAPAPGARATHPLDPLTAAECAAAVRLLRAAGHVDDAARFATLELQDPDKGDVLAWRAGRPVRRMAFAIVKAGPRTFEAVVDLTGERVASWREVTGGQPPLLTEEQVAVGEIVAGDPRFAAALRTRGLAPDRVLCAPWTLGNLGSAAHRGRRLLKTGCFAIEPGTSPFTRPVEGLWAIVDVNARTVVELHDDGTIPLSTAPGAVDAASVRSRRAPLRPVVQHRPAGSNVTVRGHVVAWDNWSFHLRMEKRSGLVVSTVSYRDGEATRAVLYQGALSELFVPYMDPDGAWASRTFMDVGEYGFGASATPLAPGVDCPASALLLDAVLPDDRGTPVPTPGVVCLFERNVGDPAWRHHDAITGSGHAGRRAVELVARMVATIGNYDYFLDWVFTQDGQLRVRIGASGYDGLKGVATRSMRDTTAARDTRFGTLVAPGLVATNHDHYFSFRLDVDVDGPRNSLSVDRLAMQRMGGARSGWTVQSQVARTERDGMLDYDVARPAHWRVINPGAPGPLGHAPGYVVHPLNSVAHGMLDDDDLAGRRAGFIRHQLWVTPRVAAERYAAGMYVNQSEGGLGLLAWTAADRSIVDTDIVLWYTAAFHHVPRTEDYPVMPSAWHEVALVPFNFFARNPALDLPPAWRSARRARR